MVGGCIGTVDQVALLLQAGQLVGSGNDAFVVISWLQRVQYLFAVIMAPA